MSEPAVRSLRDSDPCARRWAKVRIALGMAQMFGAAFSMVLLLQGGVTDIALVAVVLTGLCTTISVLLFGRRSPKRGE